jgi:hypothetical protein
MIPRTKPPLTWVPLIGQLSNLHFGANLGELLAAPSRTKPPRGRAMPQTCGCGCGQTVPAPRKFVNQDHYSVRLSQIRYFGRNQQQKG